MSNCTAPDQDVMLTLDGSGNFYDFHSLTIGSISALGRQNKARSQTRTSPPAPMSAGGAGDRLLAFERGDHHQAVSRSIEARVAADACGQLVQDAGPLMVLANVALANGDYERAQQLYDESIVEVRQAGEIWGLGIILSVAAGLRIVRHDFGSARAQVFEAMALNEELDDPRGIAWNLEVCAGLAAAEGDADTAVRLWGASDRLLDSVGGSLLPHIKWIRDRYLEPVKSALGPTLFEVASIEGRAMSSVMAVAVARRQAPLLD